MKPLNRIARFLFSIFGRRGRGVFWNPQVRMDLERLYPGVDREKCYQDFYVDKLEKSLMIILAGTVLAGILLIRAGTERRPDGDNAFLREELAAGAQDISVETVVDGKREKFSIPVWSRQLSEEEADVLYQEFRQKIPQLILRGNPSLQEVKKDLELAESFEGYPFLVEWKSEDASVLTSSGEVKRQEAARDVLLTATVVYRDQSWKEELAIRIPAQEYTEREKKRRELEKLLIASERNSREEAYWILPGMWSGEELAWSRAVEDYGLIIGLGAWVVGIAIFFLKDKDLHDELEKRRAVMKREYPDIVHKLALYIGAGMTLLGAFQKISDEYGQRREQGDPEGPAYEEMQFACREMKSGVSEGEVYVRFGRRTGLQEYIRLCTLLAQNLKKGNNALLQRLQEEADRACTERIRNSRKLGEEASTRLLVPMVMMLGVVMVMIMLPAFYSMGM